MARRIRLLLLGVAFHLAVVLLMALTWWYRIRNLQVPFPRDPKELRRLRGWGIELLRTKGVVPKGADVEHFEVQEFKTGEAFRSQCARVHVAYREMGRMREVELLAKFAPRAENLRDHAIFILQENHIKEAGVYTHLAGDPHVAMPNVYFADSNRPTGHLFVLMELMQGAVEVTERQGCPVELAGLAVDALAALHAAFWERDDPRTAFLKLVPDPVIDYFGTLFEGPDRHMFGDLLRIVWRHDSEAPTTVLHGDARVGNMLFPAPGPQGRFVLIDWQAARKGKGVFDLAYFLVLSVAPEVRRAHAAELLDRYFAALCAQGVTGYSRETLEDDYRFACLLTLAFVSLPLLSAESSSTEANTARLRDLGEVWTRRMMGLVQDLDYAWIEARTGLPAAALRPAFERSNAKALARFPA